MRTLAALSLIFVFASNILVFAQSEEATATVGLEVRFMQPTQLPGDFAILDPDSDGSIEGVVQRTEFTAESSLAPYVIWQMSNGSAVKVQFWDYDGTARAEAVSGAGVLRDILYRPDVALGSYAGTASAVSTVEAETFEATYSQPLKIVDDNGQKRRWDFVAGMRYASVDHRMETNYVATTTTETVVSTSEFDAIGLLIGSRASFDFGRRWGVLLFGNVALLSGEIDASLRHTNSVAGPGSPDLDLNDGRDQMTQMVEAGVQIEWRAWTDYDKSKQEHRLAPRAVSGRFGFAIASWDGAVQQLGEPAGDIRWDGFYATAAIAW
ncbi:hypothetical protein ABI59_15240 [Acidobacteria bacterium Mor1]|nr:hypothetical protein ABI59_15240 [Acidobacteria bacterium Mor1]